MTFSWSYLGEIPYSFSIVEGPDGRLWLPVQGPTAAGPTDLMAVTRSDRSVASFALDLGVFFGATNSQSQITSDGTDLWVTLSLTATGGGDSGGIQSYDTTGTIVDNYIGGSFAPQPGDGPINYISGFLWTTGGNWSGFDGITIYEYDPGSGVFTRTETLFTPEPFDFPFKSCVISGLLYYATRTDQVILKFDPGTLLWEADDVLDSGDSAQSICHGPDGNLWAVGLGATPKVYKIDPSSMDVLDTYMIAKQNATTPGWRVGVIAAQGGGSGVAYDFEATDMCSDGTDVWITGLFMAEDNSGWSSVAIQMHTNGSYVVQTLQALLPKEPSGDPPGTWAWSEPVAIIADDAGDIWVTDSGRAPSQPHPGAIWGPS